jgi:hypothetical protein
LGLWVRLVAGSRWKKIGGFRSCFTRRGEIRIVDLRASVNDLVETVDADGDRVVRGPVSCKIVKSIAIILGYVPTGHQNTLFPAQDKVLSFVPSDLLVEKGSNVSVDKVL